MNKLVGVLGACLSVSLACATEAEFNEIFLHQSAGQSKADLSRFRYGNPISAGEYLADVYVNNAFRGQTLLKFVEVSQNPMQGLCWSPNLLETLQIKPEAVVQEPSNSQCVAAMSATKQLSFAFDIANHRLDVSIPQALMVIHPRGYIPRSRWQSGVPAAFLRYQFNGYDNQIANKHNHQQFLGLQAGANLGTWSLRHQGSLSWRDHKRSDYRYHQVYLQRDIDQINGRLRVGDFSTQSPLLDNFAMRGVSLASDVRMLPSSQTGFAPQIQGIANSNARVRVRQNDSIIYETSVGAGPFVISDLYAFSSALGDLTVEVLEADGSKNVFSVPFFATSHMLRPRQLRYYAAMGYYRSQSTIANTPLLHSSLHYGVNNHLTAQAGVIANQDYQVASLGGVWGNKLGAWSADLQSSRANIAPQTINSSKLTLGYSKHFSQSKTYVAADMVRHFSRWQTQPAQVFLPKQQSGNEQPLKNQYRLSLSQQLGDKLGGVAVSGVFNDYWQGKDYYSYQLAYSNFFKKIQYRLGASRSYNASKAKAENAFFVSAFIPFGDFGTDSKKMSLSASYNHTPQGSSTQVGFGQSFGKQNQYDYSLSFGKHSDRQPVVSGSVNALLPMAKVGLSASKQNDSTQYSYAVSGAIIAYQHGVALNNDLSDTFAIIRAKNAKGTPILNNSGSKIDRWGNGIVSYLTPYQLNRVAIDAEGLPDDVEISATGKELVPRANTTNVVEFQTQSGQSVLFDIQRPQGLPPLTTPAYDDHHNIVGYVLQDGRLLARLDNTQGKITLTWQDDGEQRCVFDYELSAQDRQAIQIYPVACSSH